MKINLDQNFLKAWEKQGDSQKSGCVVWTLMWININFSKQIAVPGLGILIEYFLPARLFKCLDS